MKKFFRLMSLVLVCIMCLGAAAGCKDNSTDTETDSDAAIQALDGYKIIFGEGTGYGNESEYAMKLQATVKEKHGITLEVGTDYLAKGATYDSETKEILVGHTAYPQSISAAERVTTHDFLVTFDGAKIILMGGVPSALERCVDYFVENYISADSGTVEISSNEEHLELYSYAHDETTARIISLNLRYANHKNENNQYIREPRIVKLVQDAAPDSMGVQECEKFWKTQLDAAFTPLGYVSAQEDTYKGSDYTFKNFIWYNTKTVKLVESGRIWLSETPDTPSKGFGSRFYISAAWAILENKQTGAQYVHVNTHLDSESAEVRAKQLEVLIAKIKTFENKGYKVFITGDFNDNMMTDTYTTMTKSFTDARDTAKSSTQLYTYNGYKQEGVKLNTSTYKCIDYCFYKKDMNVYIDKFNVIDTYGGGYMSDHNALVIDFTLYKR